MSLRISFQGEEYLLMADSLEGNGAITTAEEYQHGMPSHAHLFGDGRVLQFGQQIGTRADITVLGSCDDPEPAADALMGLLSDGWYRR